MAMALFSSSSAMDPGQADSGHYGATMEAFAHTEITAVFDKSMSSAEFTTLVTHNGSTLDLQRRTFPLAHGMKPVKAATGKPILVIAGLDVFHVYDMEAAASPDYDEDAPEFSEGTARMLHDLGELYMCVLVSSKSHDDFKGAKTYFLSQMPADAAMSDFFDYVFTKEALAILRREVGRSGDRFKEYAAIDFKCLLEEPDSNALIIGTEPTIGMFHPDKFMLLAKTSDGGAIADVARALTETRSPPSTIARTSVLRRVISWSFKRKETGSLVTNEEMPHFDYAAVRASVRCPLFHWKDAKGGDVLQVAPCSCSSCSPRGTALIFHKRTLH